MALSTSKVVGSSAIVPFVTEASVGDLKRSALLFDQVTPVFYTSRPRARRARFPLSTAFIPDDSDRARLTAELDWLYDRGFLDVPATDPTYTGFELEDMDPERPLWILRKSNQMMATQRLDTSFTLPEVLSAFVPAEVPIFLGGDRLRDELPDPGTRMQQVIDVVLSTFPTPDDATPWEIIFDWRADSDAQVKRRRLIRWLSMVAQKADIDLGMLNNEILYLLDEYEQAMTLHDFKVRAGIFRTIVTSTAEALENIAKFKFGTLADAPFRLLGRRLERAEAERAAPGRDLAYILKARQHFA